MDFDGPFSWRGISAEQLRSLQQRLAALETMTWQTVLNSGSHFIPVAQLSREAQARLIEGNDPHLSTLKRYAEALGGRLEVRVRFPEHTIVVAERGPGADSE